MSNELIAYTYEADHHCPTCASERFGADALAGNSELDEDTLAYVLRHPLTDDVVF